MIFGKIMITLITNLRNTEIIHKLSQKKAKKKKKNILTKIKRESKDS